MVMDLETICLITLNAGETDSALAITGRCIAILEKITGADAKHPSTYKRFAKVYRWRALTYQDMDDYPASLACCQHYQRYAELAGNTLDMGASYTLMAACFREMQDTAQAIGMARKAVALLEPQPPGKNLGEAYMCLGGIYSNSERTDSAVYWFKRAVELYQGMKNVNKQGAAFLNLVEIYLAEGEKDSAAKYMDRASIVEQAWKGKASMSQYLGVKAHVRLLQGRFAEAVDLLREAEAGSDGNPGNLHEIYHLRALAEAGVQHGDSANLFMRKGNAMLVEDMDLGKARELTKVQLDFEHEKENALAEARLAGERVKKRNAMIGAGLVSALLLVLLFFYRASRRTARLLAAKNAEILSGQARLVVSEKEREAEQVRTRIARDIHDEIGSELTKITLMGNELERRMADDPLAARGLAARIKGLSKEVGAALGDVVWAVEPTNDTVLSLIEHGRAYAQRMLEGSAQAHLRFAHQGEDRSIGTATKRDLFLILKEALNNALKHSGGASITVEMNTSGQGYSLMVKDEGAGFDPSVGRKGGHGQRNMRQRAERIGGQLDVRSEAGAGTTISIAGDWS